MAIEKIRVQVGSPWPEDIDVQIQQVPSRDKKQKIIVQVDSPWPKYIDVNTENSAEHPSRAG